MKNHTKFKDFSYVAVRTTSHMPRTLMILGNWS